MLKFEVSEGQGPLCESRGNGVSTAPFPHAVDSDAFPAGWTRREGQLVRLTLWKIYQPLIWDLFRPLLDRELKLLVASWI